jgi:AbrB family looped-hinge helix DNA binding protein
MNTTVDIDKSGRLVVPRKMREALHLRAGDRLSIECSGEQLILGPQRFPKGLHMVEGWPVFDSGVYFATEEVTDWIRQDREERIAHLSG